MAHNPHAPQGSDPSQDPAGSTQMFRAFVDEGGIPQHGPAPRAAQRQSRSRVGVIVGVIAGIAIVVAAAWLALS